MRYLRDSEMMPMCLNFKHLRTSSMALSQRRGGRYWVWSSGATRHSVKRLEAIHAG